MKKALFACLLLACGGSEATTTTPEESSVAAPAEAPAAPAPEATNEAASKSSSDRISAPLTGNDLDDPSLASFCAEKTKVPVRGAFEADASFFVDGAVDLTARLSDDVLELHFRWPSKLTTDAKTGEPMRSDRYIRLEFALEGPLAAGTKTPTLYTSGGGGYDCTRHSAQSGDSSGKHPGDPSNVIITKRTDTVIEGTAEVPTKEGTERITFSAPIVTPAPPSQDSVCCLRE